MWHAEHLERPSVVQKWHSSAGSWADQPIGHFDEKAVLPFVVARQAKYNVAIDPKKIIGTSHAAYRDGMTWREFLGSGKRMHGKIDGLELTPDYYQNPSRYHDGKPKLAGWSLIEIDGEYVIDEGNHRSVIARFLCEEERVNCQVVPVVTKLMLDRGAMARAKQLAKLLRGGQHYDVVSVERGIDDDGTRLFEVLFDVWGARLATNGPVTPLAALQAVLCANRWLYRWEHLKAKFTLNPHASNII